jgi:hypothetical protein
MCPRSPSRTSPSSAGRWSSAWARPWSVRDPPAGAGHSPHVERRLLLVTPLVGLAVGVLAVIYAEASGHSFSDVLFSG